MTRSRLAVLALLAVALLFGGSRLVGDGDRDSEGDRSATGGGARGSSGLAGELAKSGRTSGMPWTAARRDGAVTIAGTVIDMRTRDPVGGVEVVFRSAAGEESTTAAADGTYRIDVAPGAYRAFVRDDSVLSVGWADYVRLPGPPVAESVGLPDEALMPLVVARTDLDGIDLGVQRGGTVRGRVVDRAGKPIANAVLRTHGGGGMRPTLGTDVAETDETGSFELKLPAGGYDLEATHPRYAGISEGDHVDVQPGGVETVTVTLTAGCVIAGRVVGPGGQPAGDGAIETMWSINERAFVPTGRIAADGTFRWFTTGESDVTLRAWPWKSPPSLSQKFACRDGARFDNVVFALPARGPDLDGVLVDRTGAPVALAYIDLTALDPGGIDQQERTDATGHWGAYQLPPGRYRVTASAPGLGVVGTTVTAPQTGLRLALGGTGRIEGTTPRLASGSLEVQLVRCHDDETGRLGLPRERRLVAVIDHRFAIEDVPACDLALAVGWQSSRRMVTASVPPGGTAQVEIGLGPAHEKTVHGIVRDADGRPVEGASVTAAVEDGEPASAVTDGAGRYSLRTVAGATVFVHSKERGAGSVEVSEAMVDDEELDIRLSPRELDEQLEPEPDIPEPDIPEPEPEPEPEPDSADSEPTRRPLIDI